MTTMTITATTVPPGLLVLLFCAARDLEIFEKISGFSIDGGIGMPFSGCFTWGGATSIYYVGSYVGRNPTCSYGG